MANELVKVGNVVPAIPHTFTPAQYRDLAEVPPELEWLANITNRKTREAYRIDVREFSSFAGLRGHAEFRTVTRAHVIAWRKQLETRDLADSTIRSKLSALSVLFDYLCEHNAVAGNGVGGATEQKPGLTMAGAPSLMAVAVHRLLFARFRSCWSVEHCRLS